MTRFADIQTSDLPTIGNCREKSRRKASIFLIASIWPDQIWSYLETIKHKKLPGEIHRQQRFYFWRAAGSYGGV